ncbi:MAG: HAD hydrolase family protein [Faecalibacterium prausnitzii]
MFFHSRERARSSISSRFTAIEGVEVVQGAPDNIEVTAAGVNKGRALLALADHLGIPAEATLAVATARMTAPCWKRRGVAAVMAKRHGARSENWATSSAKTTTTTTAWPRSLPVWGSEKHSFGVFVQCIQALYAKHCAC